MKYINKFMFLTIFFFYILLSCIAGNNASGTNDNDAIRKSKLDIKKMVLLKDGKKIYHLYHRIEKKPGDTAKIVAKYKFSDNSKNLIDGIDKSQYKIGWNNNDIIMYIEINGTEVSATEGLTVGASKSDVLRIFGIPHITHSDFIRYQNSENEVFGIQFMMDKNSIVTQIRIFAYV